MTGLEARLFQRTLAASPDRLALYAALTDGGRRRDTMLFERTEGPSLLMDKAALRIECRGESAALTALSPGGMAVLDALRETAGAVRNGDRLTIHFPRTAAVDAEERLLAPNPFDALRRLLAIRTGLEEEAFAPALLGVVAFDHADFLEDLPRGQDDPLDFPDYIFWLAESLIVFRPGAKPLLLCAAFGADERLHNDAAERLSALVERCAHVPALPALPENRVATPVEVDLDDRDYGAVVERMQAHIARGDIYQVVPSRTFRAACADPLLAYAALRDLDPSPYRFFVAAPDHILFGASPETSVRVHRGAAGATVEVKPIAGTRPRGATPDADDRLEAAMRLDAKELAEHMMLVDLARNDVARVSAPGTRRVARLMTVERYARVMHLVSSVTGTLRPGLDALHALQACLNVGTLTGAPKIRATQLLRQAERTKRGPYGGAVGWIDGRGGMDTGVVIRSAVVKDGIAFVRAGAGVVQESDPAREADETRRKASALLSVLEGAGS
ncbi:anthranilate synthase component 1 [Allosphingosinicella flava]|uniref:anthranilate synthase n=1 Tax=Allosphingosinicella flava TaxID=2771430 RepID=A0A7T2LLG2_9SPHN|nr:anthranilate synthase component 1 [Sphingosinicella flava]QPQ54338.1 anthranilate synthase component 1 [Sphingosinicella flava]